MLLPFCTEEVLASGEKFDVVCALEVRDHDTVGGITCPLITYRAVSNFGVTDMRR
jgi:hypothetical protein